MFSAIIGLLAGLLPEYLAEQRASRTQRKETVRKDSEQEAINAEYAKLRKFFQDNHLQAGDDVPNCCDHGKLVLVITLENRPVFRCPEWKNCHVWHKVPENWRNLETLRQIAVERARTA